MDDAGWLRIACELAGLCPPSGTAFSVGAVIVGADGREISRGHSREHDPHEHAEESALAKTAADLTGTTIYSSLEPCGERRSRPLTCSELILRAGIARVVFAWREPSLFVEGKGVEQLRAAGVEVMELPALADLARAQNAHLLS
ncbi:cytidine/deoxycytidylate deaminase family protein [Actinomadura rudentiformis]|uniref:dCMP deaminase n=1 Tax=Actinomadura rudentiformis TaxID=359158 RepID=A0A6H9YL06_9ACTN|nr:dCMP deaminase [Actinomadura rudentiformis]KAB2345225.1 dCMP deaminase [Actinomadura rudentiformis]